MQFKSTRPFDAGSRVLIASPDKRDVQEALDVLVQQTKADLILPPANVGSLSLGRRAATRLRKQVSCTVQRERFTLAMMGPSKEAVTVSGPGSDASRRQLVEYPAETNGEWTVVLGIAGADYAVRVDWSVGAYRR